MAFRVAKISEGATYDLKTTQIDEKKLFEKIPHGKKLKDGNLRLEKRLFGSWNLEKPEGGKPNWVKYFFFEKA